MDDYALFLLLMSICLSLIMIASVILYCEKLDNYFRRLSEIREIEVTNI